jgi:hypothetical protein
LQASTLGLETETRRMATFIVEPIPDQATLDDAHRRIAVMFLVYPDLRTSQTPGDGVLPKSIAIDVPSEPDEQSLQQAYLDA